MASTGSWMRSSGRRYFEDDAAGQEFEEGDVWGLMEEINSSGGNSLATNTRHMMRNSKSFSSNSSTQRMMIPRGATTNSAGKDIKKATSSTSSVQRSSAPLSIPERKSTMMMYGNGSNTKHDDDGSWVNGAAYGYGNNNYMNGFADGSNGHHHHDPFGHHACGYGGHHQGSYHNYNGIYGDHGDDDEDDDDDLTVVPPHEFIARRLARTQISSFSVCEGVGRKLKGRDLSEVRNAVLRKTGFLER